MRDLAAWLLEQIDWTERQAVMLDSDANMQGYGAFDRSVVADCDAKRRIVEMHEPDGGARYCGECETRFYPCRTLRALALPYADRQGYDAGWRP